jgi:glycosyltransferase involved in cell wall biosynthesis
MKVLLLSRYSWAGGSRIRSLRYIPVLEKEGLQITVAPLMDDEYVDGYYAGRSTDWPHLFALYIRRIRDLLSAGKFDLVWIERETLPYVPAFPEWFLFRFGIPYVIDYDDAIFHNYDCHRQWVVRAILGRKIDNIMRYARMVIVGNEYLAERARQAGAKCIEYLPTAVDLRGIDPAVQPQNEVFTIGWIGTPANVRYLAPIAPALQDICKNGSGRLVTVGARQWDLGGISGEVRKWSLEREPADIQSFDVGIMPLPDTPFERGKCGYKLLQYFACGRPAIASPVGVNSQIIDHGVNGFLASTIDQWIQALRVLKSDASLRRRMGQLGRQKIEGPYSIENTAPRLASLLRKAAQPVKTS